MIYVLIVMLAGSGSAVATAEFNTKPACEEAGRGAKAAREAYSASAAVVWSCSPKG